VAIDTQSVLSYIGCSRHYRASEDRRSERRVL
jgi:hypothetical protein